MIANINHGSKLYDALAYNQNKLDASQGRLLGANNLCEPLTESPNVLAYIEDFEALMPTKLQTAKPVLHISLNPHPDDRLSDDQLGDIAREYMAKMGFGEQPYLIFKHEDIERQHVHIVSLRVRRDGSPISDKFEHNRSMKATQELEQKYGLIPAKGQNRTESWQLKPIDPSLGDLKKQISAVVKPAASIYHFQTMGEFRALLSLLNVGVEEVRGEIAGKPYRGLVYSALASDGTKVGTPIKSSTISRSVGFDALEKRMERSASVIKDSRHREQTREIVAVAMQKSRNEVEFRASLRERGVNLVLRRTDQGRIYGATFVDHNNKCALNGSRLGKEFSANVFNERFGGDKNKHLVGGDKNIEIGAENILPTPKNSPHQGQVTQAQSQPRAAQVQYPVAHSQSSESPKLDIVGAVSSLFSGVSPDSTDEDYTKLIRKKKKRKRKFGQQM